MIVCYYVVMLDTVAGGAAIAVRSVRDLWGVRMDT